MSERGEDIAMADASNPTSTSTSTTTSTSALKRKQPPARGHQISHMVIKTPPFSYAYLSLMTSSPPQTTLDEITVRSYLTSALTQFLGLSGAAISVDILKVEAAEGKKVDDGGEVWVRVPREDLAPFLAAVGGWVGEGGKVGWRVKGSGNWLSALVGGRDEERIWND